MKVAEARRVHPRRVRLVDDRTLVVGRAGLVVRLGRRAVLDDDRPRLALALDRRLASPRIAADELADRTKRGRIGLDALGECVGLLDVVGREVAVQRPFDIVRLDTAVRRRLGRVADRQIRRERARREGQLDDERLVAVDDLVISLVQRAMRTWASPKIAYTKRGENGEVNRSRSVGRSMSKEGSVSSSPTS